MDKPDAPDPSIREYAGRGVVITWEPGRCRHAAECVRGLPTVFDSQARPWIDAGGAGVEEIVAVVDRCPSYALGYRTEDGRTRTAPPDA
ncbi:(4Fe-4S)-binding protein [Nocardioides sp.]|uniref:(4Fe-4S)-binding protein n=1 Tax=Nocardioides sp. TaxID=35761 RepID=UPI00260C78D6|nr:(4Fe-4S)-binding protein [Nocardioides sp.]